MFSFILLLPPNNSNMAQGENRTVLKVLFQKVSLAQSMRSSTEEESSTYHSFIYSVELCSLPWFVGLIVNGLRFQACAEKMITWFSHIPASLVPKINKLDCFMENKCVIGCPLSAFRFISFVISSYSHSTLEA